MKCSAWWPGRWGAPEPSRAKEKREHLLRERCGWFAGSNVTSKSPKQIGDDSRECFDMFCVILHLFPLDGTV